MKYHHLRLREEVWEALKEAAQPKELPRDTVARLLGLEVLGDGRKSKSKRSKRKTDTSADVAGALLERLIRFMQDMKRG